MNVHNLDTEKFISEVKKFPQIWDLNSEDYRYKNRKQRAWAQIACVIIPGFEEFPDSEKMVTYKKLNDKWRNLRDSYVRAKRVNSKKTYMYAAQLKFLKDIYSISSQSEGEECIDVSPKLSKSNHFEAWNSDDSSADMKTNIRKCEDDTEFVNVYPTETCTTSFSIEDEDKSFFDSLLPAVREFSLDQKLEFRAEVISLVKKIRNTHVM